jgi:uncharacterized membrane protein
MITIPGWLSLTCGIVGAWVLISVIIVTPLIILGAVSRRRDQRNAETVRRASAALVTEAERIANGHAS